jgi:hypothetical protein
MSTLDEIQDRYQIEQVLRRYCRGVDRFEKHNNRWAISQRSVVYDWSQIQDVGQEYDHQNFELGKRSTEDLSYKRT